MSGISEVVCQWCNGTGSNHVEDSLYCRCEDCQGTGWRTFCDECGEEIFGDYCENCFGVCESCGDNFPKEELFNGMCNDCANEEGRRKNA